jgi:hypothetical protein
MLPIWSDASCIEDSLKEYERVSLISRYRPCCGMKDNLDVIQRTLCDRTSIFDDRLCEDLYYLGLHIHCIHVFMHNIRDSIMSTLVEKS